MTEDTFVNIVLAFGDYWATRGREPDTWGLFAGLGLTHISAGRFNISLQFCNPDGRCDDLKVLEEFLDRFQAIQPDWRACAVPGDKRFATRRPEAHQRRAPTPLNANCGWRRPSVTAAVAMMGAQLTSPAI